MRQQVQLAKDGPFEAEALTRVKETPKQKHCVEVWSVWPGSRDQ